MGMKTAAWLLVTAIACMGSSCAKRSATKEVAQKPPARAPEPAMGERMGMTMCPAMIPGVEVATEEAPGGIAVTLTASPGQVAEVRERVRRVADMHTRMQERQPVRGEEPGMGKDTRCMMKLPDSDASVEEIEGGSRIVLSAKNPEDIEELRAQVRQHAEHMKHGGCPTAAQD